MKLTRTSIVYLIITFVIFLQKDQANALTMEIENNLVKSESESAIANNASENTTVNVMKINKFTDGVIKSSTETEMERKRRKKRSFVKEPSPEDVTRELKAIESNFVEETGKPKAKNSAKTSKKDKSSDSQSCGKNLGQTTQKQTFVSNPFLDFMEDQTIKAYTVNKDHFKSGFMYILEKAKSYSDVLSFTKVFVKISNDIINFYGNTEEASKFKEIPLVSVTRIGHKYPKTTCFEIIYVKNAEVSKLVKSKLLRAEMTVCGLDKANMKDWIESILKMKPSSNSAETHHNKTKQLELKANVLADFTTLNKAVKIQPSVRKIIKKKEEKANAPLIYAVEKNVLDLKQATRISGPVLKAVVAAKKTKKKMLLETPVSQSGQESSIISNLDSNVLKSNEKFQKELKDIHEIIKQSSQKSSIAKRNFLENLNKLKSQKTEMKKQKEMIEKLAKNRKLKEDEQKSKYRQELINKRTAALLKKTKESLRKLKADELDKIQSTFKKELENEKIKVNSNAVEMLSCIKNEEKNKDASVCYDYNVVGGFKNEKAIKNLCKKFYGEKGASTCSTKEKFCDFCCSHFIGIKFPQKKISCHQKCSKTIKAGAKKEEREYPPVPDVPKSGCAIIFEEENFNGNAMQICNKKINKLDSLWPFKILSIKVGEATTINLHEKPNYSGKHLKVSENSANVNRKGFDRNFHSAKVENNPTSQCIILYEKVSYGGDSILLCDHTGDIKPLKSGMISSVKVGDSVNITAFEKKGAKGKSLIISSNSPDIHKAGLFNISYVQIFNKSKLGCTVIFEKPNFQGDSQQICNKVTGNSIGWDSSIGSVKVGESTHFVFYKSSHFKGKAGVVKEDLKDFNKAFPKTKVLSADSDSVAAFKTAIIFSKDDYTGSYYVINDDTIESFPSVGWESKVGSIKLGPGMKLVLYEKLNYKGKSISITKSTPKIASIFRKFVPHSSRYQLIQIPNPKDGCVILFDQLHFGGSNRTICPGSINNLAGIWSGDTLSIKVGKGALVSLYSSSNRKGKVLKLVRDETDLRTKKFTKIGSIKVEKPKIPPMRGPVSDWRINKVDSSVGVVAPIQSLKEVNPKAIKRVAKTRNRLANTQRNQEVTWRQQNINTKSGTTALNQHVSNQKPNTAQRKATTQWRKKTINSKTGTSTNHNTQHKQTPTVHKPFPQVHHPTVQNKPTSQWRKETINSITGTSTNHNGLSSHTRATIIHKPPQNIYHPPPVQNKPTTLWRKQTIPQY